MAALRLYESYNAVMSAVIQYDYGLRKRHSYHKYLSSIMVALFLVPLKMIPNRL